MNMHISVWPRYAEGSGSCNCCPPFLMMRSESKSWTRLAARSSKPSRIFPRSSCACVARLRPSESLSVAAMVLETAVGRPPGCVRRGAWQGESGPVDPVNRRNRSNTRRNSSSIPTSCNAARLRVRSDPFQGQQFPPRGEQRARNGPEPGQGRQGAGGDGVEARVGTEVLHPGVLDLGVGKTQLDDRLAHESRLLGVGIYQGEGSQGLGDCQRDTGQAGPCAQVQHPVFVQPGGRPPGGRAAGDRPSPSG